ncbi:MAG: hypothetical protein JSR82_17055 [Verrucomicrobia bacterium]|nr:hypothetical protein [Verrucomicrobiota bacterium]
MNIRQVFGLVHRMYLEGVVESYAIGGAVGATFYLEPVATLDVDVFVAFRSPGLLVDARPVFEWLQAAGGESEGEYVILAGTPVQILSAGTPLVEEAIRDAAVLEVEGQPVRVFSAEHLAAIALEVGRAKDKARLLQFIEEGVLDPDRFEAVLRRHHLLDRWTAFQRQFLA